MKHMERCQPAVVFYVSVALFGIVEAIPTRHHFRARRDRRFSTKHKGARGRRIIYKRLFSRNLFRGPTILPGAARAGDSRVRSDVGGGIDGGVCGCCRSESEQGVAVVAPARPMETRMQPVTVVVQPPTVGGRAQGAGGRTHGETRSAGIVQVRCGALIFVVCFTFFTVWLVAALHPSFHGPKNN